LELGGSNAAANLWPEPEGAHSNRGYPRKDQLENHLHALVCAGRLRLRTAQQAIAANWVTAYDRYATVPVAAHRAQPPRPQRPVHRAKPVPPGGGATARCNDGTYSYAAHHQGACSHHHGVAVFYK
jgi:hypothetical protein